MLMAAQQRYPYAGIILNDIGPEIHQEGLARLKSYAGKSSPVKSWEDAAAQTRRLNEVAFPHYSQQQWLRFARQLYAENGEGVPVLSYDPGIATAIERDPNSAVPEDLWDLFRATREFPTLLIHGAISDILHSDCVKQMQKENPAMRVAEIDGIGHAPMLDEPQSLSAIRKFLSDKPDR